MKNLTEHWVDDYPYLYAMMEYYDFVCRDQCYEVSQIYTIHSLQVVKVSWIKTKNLWLIPICCNDFLFFNLKIVDLFVRGYGQLLGFNDRKKKSMFITLKRTGRNHSINCVHIGKICFNWHFSSS